MFTIEIGHNDGLFAMGLVMEVWHTYTHTHTVIHRCIFSSTPQKKEPSATNTPPKIDIEPENRGLVQMIFLFQRCILYSQVPVPLIFQGVFVGLKE